MLQVLHAVRAAEAVAPPATAAAAPAVPHVAELHLCKSTLLWSLIHKCMRPSTDLIDSALGAPRNALWVRPPFCRLCCLRQKVSTFRAATDPKIYTNTLSNEITFVIQPGKTHGYVKKPPSID